MTVTPLGLDASERLEKMARWCQEFTGPQSLTGRTWQEAADQFFYRFAPNGAGDAMIRPTAGWIPMDLAEHTGRSERIKHCDMVFKFFERDRGRFGVRLVGTVEVRN